MSKRCRTENGAWIPECMGGAVYGRSGCTCAALPKPTDDIRKRLRWIATEVALLERELAAVTKQRNELREALVGLHRYCGRLLHEDYVNRTDEEVEEFLTNFHAATRLLQ